MGNKYWNENGLNIWNGTGNDYICKDIHDILKPYARNIFVDGDEWPASLFRHFYPQERSSDIYALQDHKRVFQRQSNEEKCRGC
jgi:hypothetical protein